MRLALDEIGSQNASGGLIVLTGSGSLGVGFNSPNMAYAWKTLRAADAAVAPEQ